MKKSNKILSLLLAFVMVFAAFVPAFAKTPGPGQTTGNADFTIKLRAQRHGRTTGANVNVTITSKKAGETTNGRQEGVYAVENGAKDIELGKFTSGNSLEANRDYYVTVDTKEVLPKTTYEYKFTTNDDGKVVSNGKVVEELEFGFDLYFEQKEGYAFTVWSLEDMSNKLKGNVEFEVRNVQYNDNGTYKLGKNKEFLADMEGEVLYTNTTSDMGDFNLPLTNAKLANVTEVETPVKQSGSNETIKTKMVAFVVNGKVQAFADLNHDKVAVIRDVASQHKIEIEVVGVDFKQTRDGGAPAYKAIKDAVIELQANETEVLKEQKFGKVLASVKTDANGKATIENAEISKMFSILGVDGSNERMGYKGYTLFNRIMVTKADGYQVPVGIELNFCGSDRGRDLGNLQGSGFKVEREGNKYTFILMPTDFGLTSRVSGKNRYATSVEAAKQAFPKYKETLETAQDKKNQVIIASGDVFADALVANGLVGKYNSPLLLNGVSKLDPAVKAYLKEIGAKDVIIVGGNGSISGSVTNELTAMGISSRRIFGTNRYETSVKVLEDLFQNVEGKQVNKKKVLVASGENFADALVASVPSALKGQPILLTAKDNLPKVVKDAIQSRDYGIEEVTIIGGTGSVSSAVEGQIGLRNTDRLQGKNRQLTSMVVSNSYFTNGGSAIIVDGTDFADALAAGQLACKKNAPILLTASKTDLGKELANYLRTNKMTDITIVGGTGSVSTGIQQQLEEILAGK
ncbi:cell wall-binding repeat-containing protein [Lagierella sp. ICN-221743]